MQLHVQGASAVRDQASSTWNFCLTERWVFPDDGDRRLDLRFVLFLAMNNSTLLLRVPTRAY